jgi:hypothetical protein
MYLDNGFATTIDKLLSGIFICPIASYDEYNYLDDENNRDKVDRYLRQVGKTLSSIDKELYYCSYTELDGEKQKHCKGIIRDVEGQLRPIVEFLSLHLRCSNNDSALYTGDEISLTFLVGKIEHDKSLQKNLDRLIILTKSRPRESVLENVKVILKFLVSCEVIMQYNANLGTYICTGKLAYILSLMEFIRSNQQEKFTELDQDEPFQLDLG